MSIEWVAILVPGVLTGVFTIVAALVTRAGSKPENQAAQQSNPTFINSGVNNGVQNLTQYNGPQVHIKNTITQNVRASRPGNSESSPDDSAWGLIIGTGIVAVIFGASISTWPTHALAITVRFCVGTLIVTLIASIHARRVGNTLPYAAVISWILTAISIAATAFGAIAIHSSELKKTTFESLHEIAAAGAKNSLFTSRRISRSRSCLHYWTGFGHFRCKA
ncbi:MULTISPECIES: hypothetical protein [unclassified Arthrobacter]|uniref:hypothetical protein n=1 Tax=unclassified Arthrobacter TaxID=235627 RepID=UPI0011AFEA2D|nr:MULTISPECIES: hypothetical protein [unclassified Arthrobacter]